MVNLFISFKDEDISYREAFEGILQNPNANLNHAPVSAREDYRPQGEEAIKKYLIDLIKDSDSLVCLIGKETSNSEWVDFELSVASSLNKGISSIRIPETSGEVPKMIKSKNLKQASWDRDEINRVINKAIKFTRSKE